MSTCRRCGAEMLPDGRFCGSCGTPTRGHARAVAARDDQERRRTTRAAMALAVVAAGTLFGLLSSSLVAASQQPEWVPELLQSAAVFVAAALAAVVWGSLRLSLPLRTDPRWLLAALPAAGLSFAVAVVYVHLLPAAGEPDSPTTMVWITTVVLAPIGEEWLCRGAAFGAATTLASAPKALLLTSILFAFLHGLGGGFLLELPHRFVAGLVFGWLRWRSGSLVPGMAAHVLHNTFSILLADL